MTDVHVLFTFQVKLNLSENSDFDIKFISIQKSENFSSNTIKYKLSIVFGVLIFLRR